CESGARPIDSPLNIKTNSWAYRYLRRQILTVRSDLLHSNCIYGMYDLSRSAIGALRKKHSHPTVTAAFRREGGVTHGTREPRAKEDPKTATESRTLPISFEQQIT